MRVAIVGGTGPFGKALAARLHDSGWTCRRLAGRRAGRSDGCASSAAAARRTPTRARTPTSSSSPSTPKLRSTLHASCADSIGSTPLLSVASELRFTKAGALPAADPAPSPSGSRPSSTGRSVGASLARRIESRSREPPDEDAFVCGDDADAKAQALDLAGRLTAGRALDAGPLASARALEGFTAVIVNMNRRYKGHAGIRVTGLG